MHVDSKSLKAILFSNGNSLLHSLHRDLAQGVGVGRGGVSLKVDEMTLLELEVPSLPVSRARPFLVKDTLFANPL